MPANRYFYPEKFHLSESIFLEEKEASHLTKVMRQRIGDEIELINGKGELASGKIIAAHKDKAEIEITHITTGKPDDFSLVLALAFLKPQHLEFALEKAVELGVSEIWLFPADRSEKREISDTYKQRLDTILIASCKQCGRLFSPKLIIKKDLKSCIEPDRLTFVGSPDSSLKKLSSYQAEITLKRAITICIGPEAGFSMKELETLTKLSVQNVHFHPNTLRAETAAISAILLLHSLLSS